MTDKYQISTVIGQHSQRHYIIVDFGTVELNQNSYKIIRETSEDEKYFQTQNSAEWFI